MIDTRESSGGIRSLAEVVADMADMGRESLWERYWVKNVPTKQLMAEEGCSHIHVLLKRVGPCYLLCDICEGPISISSRTALKEALRRCSMCREKEARERQEEYDRQRIEWQQHLHELRTMPYSEYLQTEHWQETRKQALKRAGFKCQMCGAKNVRLHVHHNTYENRGNERPSDLVALCEPCHETFHRRAANGSGKTMAVSS